MMEKSTNKNNKNFLKKGFTDVSKHHKEYLGTDLPEDYFVTSKLSILKKIKEESTVNTFLKEKISRDFNRSIYDTRNGIATLKNAKTKGKFG